jgi:alkaline phosphatase D
MAFDDHEVDNDYAGSADEHDTPPEVFLLRRAAAYQAYYETMPLRREAFPRGPDIRMYSRMKFGALMDMSVLDTRQFRSDQACGGGTVTGCRAAADPARTMLGTDQERWLFEQLPAVRAKWTVIAQQVPMVSRDASGANPQAQYSMDKWDGYTADRDRVFSRLTETKAPNRSCSQATCTCTMARISSSTSKPRSETVGVEFTNTSITSGSDGTDVAAIWDQIRGDNPTSVQRAARIHRLHRHACHHARRFQDSRPRDDTRPADENRRFSRRRGWPSRSPTQFLMRLARRSKPATRPRRRRQMLRPARRTGAPRTRSPRPARR